ncbi:PREDICTED: putative nuclease HARBI1 [Cyphomyrmex costatus]|uniref:putative nuclease HARBI1 n=1 Tax=Cyphomyrmex costatus TaxID=456900 RepID=UPI0008523525|nr:PREDICTED: putative nuclease HARBI1 [Cyphomyrmex costatus]
MELIDSDNSSSDSDLSSDSSDEELLLLHDTERIKVLKVDNYCDIICHMHDKTFQSHFRLTRSSFEIVRGAIAPLFQPVNNERGHPNVSLEKTILSTLWLLGNQDSFREVGNLFDLSPIDGMHIEIPAPRDDPMSYYNRKGFHSIILQGICDAKCQFIDIFIGWPGATHEARVWRESPIGQALTEDPTLLPEGTHIIGDSAYSLQTYLLTPFRDNGHLSPRQKLYNKKLSSKRVVIEQGFGRLKVRFRRLKFLNMSLMNEMKIVVVAACVLHNICIRYNDETELSDNEREELDEGQDEDDHILETANDKRNRIADTLWANRR